MLSINKSLVVLVLFTTMVERGNCILCKLDGKLDIATCKPITGTVAYCAISSVETNGAAIISQFCTNSNDDQVGCKSIAGGVKCVCNANGCNLSMDTADASGSLSALAGSVNKVAAAAAGIESDSNRPRPAASQLEAILTAVMITTVLANFI